MAPKPAGSSRPPCVEGFRFTINEGGPRSGPGKPYFLTYLGEGVEEVKGVGLFQKGTTAEVDAEIARSRADLPGWKITDRDGKALGAADIE